MRHSRITPQRRSLQMFAFSLIGLWASVTAVLVAAFAERSGTTASSAMAMAFLLGISMCTAGVLHFCAYEEESGRGLVRLVAVVSVLGYLALVIAAVLWFIGGPGT